MIKKDSFLTQRSGKHIRHILKFHEDRRTVCRKCMIRPDVQKNQRNKTRNITKNAITVEIKVKGYKKKIHRFPDQLFISSNNFDTITIIAKRMIDKIPASSKLKIFSQRNGMITMTIKGRKK